MQRSKLVGILNVTPDSFSDGGRYLEPHLALSHMTQLIEEGADVIDIGAESTRPGATPLSTEEEWERLAAIIKPAVQLSEQAKVPLSIDTRHGQTAKRVLDAGVAWINDVSGCADPEMLEVLSGSECAVVVMHNLGVPVQKEVIIDESRDPLAVIHHWCKEKICFLEKHGIKRDRVILDPGVGFGKSAQQSWQVIQEIERLNDLGVPLYVGHSCKSFMRDFTEDYDQEKAALTVTLSAHMSAKGVDYLRVHDIAAHVRAFSVIEES